MKIIALPSLKDYPSRKQWEGACWLKILDSKELLQLVITPNERHNLVKRVVALDSIISGKSYRNISKDLWLSLQTISGLKKALKENNYRSYKDRNKTERKKRKYSPSLILLKGRKYRGRPVRTKYGLVHIPD